MAKSHLVDANTYCKRPVERLAQYDFEWTDGWLTLKFRHYIQSERPGTFIYIGDSIKLQNGFGAWQPHIYACEYRPSTKTVVEVSASPGRL
ncbi:MAG: hypothetical protein RJQ10_11500 [Haliea sp.]|uniref:hypothetical protein n=1 Tax=Haliea sp. TaxID=1932666 RepID=UPI0032EFF60F